MNIERAIKVIDNIQYVQVFDERLDRVKDFIESQQKTIEDMKCCQNCKHGEGYNITCHNEKVNNSTLRGCKCKGGHPEDTKLWESDCC